ncbi:MAG: CBS domain-containing protein [Desulfurococcales archaeon]|nr:CBS domain-containing protein [Desulfurococcales archaeon]
MRRAYRVEEVMTRKPVTARVGETVMDAVMRMAELSIGALPVVDESGRLVGIFTERDLLKRVVAKGLDPRETRIEEVMTPNPVTVSPDDTVEEALRIMKKIKARHLPVVDREGKLVGIVSIKDIEFVEP